MIRQGQPFRFGLDISLIAEVADVPQAALHTDVDAICYAYEAIRPVAERLGVEPPQPRLAGLTYVHVSTLGARVTITPESPEPHVSPCIHSPDEIDRLAEPEDYLAEGVVPERLALVDKLLERRPDASRRIGHAFEGPITTAALLMGQDFFTLPYEDPARARRLLAFCVRSALNYWRVLQRHQGETPSAGPRSFPDDFAGMFPPEKFRQFVLPAWEMMYDGLQATWRGLHSELIREEHLPLLGEARIGEFDSGVDQYLPPEALRRSCPVPFSFCVWPAHVLALSAKELTEMYKSMASFNPTVIKFSLERLADEPKIAALLEVARKLAGA